MNDPNVESIVAEAAPSTKTVMMRGIRGRCPRCGEGKLFRRYNIMIERCDACGLKYLQDQGDLFGYLFLIDRALFVAPLIVMIYFRAYVPNQNWFYGLCVVMLFALFYTLPHRTGMSLALEYLFRRKKGTA
jgi:uncharacterized protein (DUF983 family)